jgi:CubicO group peptidase (beta-lactamase class C family)
MSQTSPALSVVLIALTLAAGCAGGDAVRDPSTVEDPRIDQVLSGLLPPVPIADQPGWTLEERMDHWKVPGVSIAVIQDFEVAWTRAYGTKDVETGEPVSTSTLFQAGSISKPVAAAGALRMVEQERLALEQPINEVLSSWKVPDNERTAEAPVTLRGLLSHTAGTTVHGFPGYRDGQPVPELQQVLDGSSPANTFPVRVDVVPGSRFRYSGGGTTIVQQAMIDVADTGFPELLRELVLEPAEMSESTYVQPLPAEREASAATGHWRNGVVVPGKRHVYPEMAAAGLWTTAIDLARFAVAIQKSFRGDESLLEPSTAEKMLTPVMEDAALGFFIDDREGDVYFTHGGADEGFQAMLVASRDHGYGAVVMANSDNGINLAGEIIRSIAKVYGWAGYLREPVAAAEIDVLDLELYGGRYLGEGDDLVTVLLSVDDLLERRPFTPQRSRLVPLGKHVFLHEDSGRRVRFEPGDDGSFERLVRLDDAGEPAGEPLARTDRELLPIEFLETGKTQEAVSVLRESRDEKRINRLGYRLLGNQRVRQAIAVFKLNTLLFPDSANVWDSLADGHLMNRDRERAEAAFRKVLEVAARDRDVGSEYVNTLAERARAQLGEDG